MQAGYDYLLDPLNSVAILASYGKIDYTRTGSSTGAASSQIDKWFIGANLGRRVGPHAQINFNYGATRQNFPPSAQWWAVAAEPGFNKPSELR